MRDAMITVVAIGAAAWLFVNYRQEILNARLWRSFAPLTLPSNFLTLALIVAPILILLLWVSFRKRGR